MSLKNLENYPDECRIHTLEVWSHDLYSQYTDTRNYTLITLIPAATLID